MLEQYERVKNGALRDANIARAIAEENYANETAGLQLAEYPNWRTADLWWEAENDYRHDMVSALETYEKTCLEALEV